MLKRPLHCNHGRKCAGRTRHSVADLVGKYVQVETDKFRVGEVGESIIRTARGSIGRGNLNYTEGDIDLYRHRDSGMSA